MQIPYILTETSVSIFGADFAPKIITHTHPAWDEVVAALKAGDEAKVRQLSDLPAVIVDFMQGAVSIHDRVLYFKDRPLDTALTRRILQFMEAGDRELAKPLVAFLEKVMENPSRRAVTGLFEWVERSTLPITPEGDILAWKIVQDDYLDVHSKSFDNSVGNVVEVSRNEVDEDPDRTCSYGLHFCSTAYLPHYGGYSSSRRVMVVRINPADVVAFPRDYGTSKGRCCRYEVIGEIPAEKAREFFPGMVAEPTFRYDDAAEVELDVGGVYRTRAGALARVTGEGGPDDPHPFTGTIRGIDGPQSWAIGGSWAATAGDHANDIVEEVDTVGEVQLGRYETRGGDIAEIDDIADGVVYGALRGTRQRWDEQGYAYSGDGDDLVELLPAQTATAAPEKKGSWLARLFRL